MLSPESKYPIAIDMNNDDIYVVQLKKSRETVYIRGMACKKSDGEVRGIIDGGDALVSFFKEIAKDSRFSGKHVVLHLPSRNISSFPITIKLGKEEGLEEAILRESKEYISFPIEEAIIDYPSVTDISSGDSSQFKAEIITVRRSHITEYLHILKKAGFIVDAVDFGVSSLLRLHNYLFEAPKNPTLLCNIENTQSLISVVTENRILAERHVTWGLRYLIAKIEANLELANDEQKTKVLLNRYGLTYDNQQERHDGKDLTEEATKNSMGQAIYQIIMPYVDELIDEFHKMNAYLRSEERDSVIEGIYIYGQAVFIHDLDRYIQKRLNLPTMLVNPMTDFVLRDHSILYDISEGAPFGLALGLALRNMT